MTPAQRQLARHALGLTNGRRQSYRNHFVTGEGSTDYPHWVAMVEAGDARRRAGNELSGGDDVFWLTPNGAIAALGIGETLDPKDFPGLVAS